MRIEDLLNVIDNWTHIIVEDIYTDEIVLEGMFLELGMGIWQEDCQNLLFDEEAHKILQMKVSSIEIEEGAMKINAFYE